MLRLLLAQFGVSITEDDVNKMMTDFKTAYDAVMEARASLKRIEADIAALKAIIDAEKGDA